MFVGENERLIVVDQRGAQAPLDGADFRALAAVGVRTVLLEAWASWHAIEPNPSQYDWQALDERVELALASGMKVLLPTYHRAPDWWAEVLPKAAVYGNGTDAAYGLRHLALDPRWVGVAEAEQVFICAICEHYLNWMGVRCIYGVPYLGEAIMPKGAWNRDIVQGAVINRQRVFAAYGDELWTSFHPAYNSQGYGNEYTQAIYAAMREKFPDHRLNRLVWTFFTSEGCQWKADVEARHWVGAEYADNVVRNAGRLSQWGMWGMICALRPFAAEGALEHWRIDAVGEAIELLNAQGGEMN